MARAHLKLPSLTTQQIERFNQFVASDGTENSCWPWTAAKNKKKGQEYGRFKLRRKTFTAHRVAYFIAAKTDPGDLLVCHICDNPPCCNPAHLFLGTSRDNQIDALNKGRAHPARGETHYAAKLSKTDIWDMRVMYIKGDTIPQIAKYYEVHYSTAYDIVHHRKRRHV